MVPSSLQQFHLKSEGGGEESYRQSLWEGWRLFSSACCCGEAGMGPWRGQAAAPGERGVGAQQLQLTGLERGGVRGSAGRHCHTQWQCKCHVPVSKVQCLLVTGARPVRPTRCRETREKRKEAGAQLEAGRSPGYQPQPAQPGPAPGPCPSSQPPPREPAASPPPAAAAARQAARARPPPEQLLSPCVSTPVLPRVEDALGRAPLTDSSGSWMAFLLLGCCRPVRLWLPGPVVPLQAAFQALCRLRPWSAWVCI